ncbi:MAG: hypothetical protein M1836_000486 [Candelina mexicana]|nr:MAG: hypothetical protein M1836_000486 [Candelina mexicana]
MSSSVFFKFKSQKDPSRVTFDGTGISVFELKREIININRLGDGTDFDLAIYNEDSNEEYDDDTTIIPRSTSITARRLPPAKAGRGNGARYVSGKAPVNARNTSKMEAPTSKLALQGSASKAATAIVEDDGPKTEEEQIAAMFQAGAAQWEQQKKEMATATPVYRSGPKGKHVNVPDHKPPPGYICYRCGEKGHWIQACPTNDDPNFDGRPRVKRTTGIPRSFLKTIQKPAALTGDGTTDDARQPAGVMVNADGEFVVAEPDKASWEQYQAKTKVSAAAQAAAVAGSKELQERGLECSIDKRMFVEPMKTPCCGKTYCNECITSQLIESDLICPGCSTESVLIDNLVSDDEMNAKIKIYEDEKAKEKAEKEKSKSPTPKKEDSPTIVAQKSKSESPTSGPIRGTSSTPISSTNISSNKRPAEEELENPRVPQGPAAMRNSQGNQQPKTVNGLDHQLFNTLNGFHLPMSFDSQPGFSNGNFMQQQGMNHMGYPNGNFFGGMPTSMAPLMSVQTAMMNPNIYSAPPYMATGGAWNAMGNMGYLPQQNSMYGGNYNAGMMSNGGYSQPAMPLSMSMGNAAIGMTTVEPNTMQQPMLSNGRGTGVFPNQQRTIFSEPFPNEEDNAYFRKPVNPHRHQARQRRVRPSDYREV